MSEPMDTREEVELPALDVTEEELQLAQSNMIALWGVEGMNEQAIAYRNTYAEEFCRERQLKASLANNRELREKVANAEAFEILAQGKCNELELANREQKAEIERLQAALACKEAEVELTLNRYRELASKRCSCGRSEALATIPAVQGMDK